MGLNDNISKWVEENFGFSDKVKVKPLRAYTNDVYEIENGGKHLLKVYGDGWKTESEVLWEIELLEYLKEHHVGIAGIIEGKTGKKLFTLDIEGNQRLVVMFEWAKGKKPTPPFSMDDYELLGKATAKIHQVSDNFQSNQQRQELGTDYLIDKPLLIILGACCNNDKARYFQNCANKLRGHIQKFESMGLDWGVVHTDVTFDNVHITDDREIVFYDFDSGGLGWRAIDLQGWAVFDAKTAPRQVSFIKGYRTVTRLSDNDIAASPYLHAANEFWGVGLDLNRRVLKQGEGAVSKYLSGKIKMFDMFSDYFESM